MVKSLVENPRRVVLPCSTETGEQIKGVYVYTALTGGLEPEATV